MTEYLRLLKPIVTGPQYERTDKIIKQFLVQPGPKLHQYLVDKREAEDNWVRIFIAKCIMNGFHATQICCEKSKVKSSLQDFKIKTPSLKH